MFKNLLGKAGFSLIQSMFLAALVAGMALVGTKVVTDLKVTTKSAQTRDDLEAFHEMITSVLLDVANCKVSYPQLLLPSGSRRILLADGTELVKEGGVYVNKSLKVESMVLDSASANPGLTIQYSRLKLGTTIAGIGAKDLKKFIPLSFVKKNGILDRCYVDQSQLTSGMIKDFCTNLSANFLSWDPASNSCRFNNHTCGGVPGTIFLGIDSTGKEICRKFNEAFNPSDVFVLGSLSYCTKRQSLWLGIDSTGKIRMYCSNSTTTSPSSCTTPWGSTVASGGSVTAYVSTSPACGVACQAEIRNCSNGVLSGSYTKPSCTPSSCTASCALPWGGTIAHGASVTAYSTTSPSCPKLCTDSSQTRTCSNGALSGSYTNKTCTDPSCSTCSFPDEPTAKMACDKSGGTPIAPTTSIDCANQAKMDPSLSCFDYSIGGTCSGSVVCKTGSGPSCYPDQLSAKIACSNAAGTPQGFTTSIDCANKAAINPKMTCYDYNVGGSCIESIVCDNASASCLPSAEDAIKECQRSGGEDVFAGRLADCQMQMNGTDRCIEYNEAGSCDNGILCREKSSACCPSNGQTVIDCNSCPPLNPGDPNLCMGMSLQCG